MKTKINFSIIGTINSRIKTNNAILIPVEYKVIEFKNCSSIIV